MKKIYKNILIIKPSSLGDVVLTLPVLSEIRKRLPDAKISWLIKPEFEVIIKNHPLLHRTILFDRELLGKFWYSKTALAALLSLLRQLRKSKFDLILDFQGLFRTGALAWLSGCKRRAGMANAREFARYFYNITVKQEPETIHLVDYFLKILSRCIGRRVSAPEDSQGIEKPEFNLTVEPTAVDEVKNLLKAENISLDNYAVIVPGSAHTDKCWPVEKFAAIAEKIATDFGLSIIVTGTKADSEITDKLLSESRTKINDFTGKTNLSQLAALLKSAKIVVGNDTGPIHIAAVLETPVVAIFGRSNPARIQPYKDDDAVAAIEPHSRGLKISNQNPKYDIKNIGVEVVYGKICKQLGG